MLNRISRVIPVLFLLFSSHSIMAVNYDFVVAPDGSGNFTSIQKAIDACKAFQDTVYAAGRFSRMLFTNCHIEGTTDFLFGEANVLFEKCTIHCKADSYITAASTPEGNPFGFVFMNCKLTAEDGVEKVYLGRRPWRIYARVAFLKCEMGSFIKPEGWNNWDKPDAEKNTFFAEHKNTGTSVSPGKRVKWSHQLSDDEVSPFTPENILGDWVTHTNNSKFIIKNR